MGVWPPSRGKAPRANPPDLPTPTDVPICRAIVGGQADNGRVTEQSNYAVSLADLEKSVRVTPEDMVETQAVSSLHEYVDPAERVPQSAC